VRDKKVHLEVIQTVMEFAQSLGFGVLGLEFSPIRGPEGNIEYLLYLQNYREGEDVPSRAIDAAYVVEESHRTLQG
jgi:23S rRNA (cytidine1920-2'-O)/16S rRNA (cytidine1409-2'-O)-methyltransferase